MSKFFQSMMKVDALKENYFKLLSTQVQLCFNNARSIEEFYQNTRAERLIMFQEKGELYVFAGGTTIPISELGISKKRVDYLRKLDKAREDQRDRFPVMRKRSSKNRGR